MRLREAKQAHEANPEIFPSEGVYLGVRSALKGDPRMAAYTPTGKESWPPDSLNDVVVIAADEVGRYCDSLPSGTNIADVVTTLAPPFDRCFIEFQGAHNPVDAYAWGVLVESIWPRGAGDPKESEIGWHLMLTLFIESKKGVPAGPIARYFAALDREGNWFRDDDGTLVWQGSIVEVEPSPPAEVRQETADGLVTLLFPALLTLSFMHCRNVEARSVEAPAGLSKKWRKKTGRDLVRHQVLEISPMKSVLDSQGRAHQDGIGSALHICRGHFKTFSEDAPLFGRVTGQFWWPQHVRGSADQGEIKKSYAIDLDRGGLGQTYIEANDDVTPAPRSPSTGAPDAAGRGLRAHNKVQNSLALAVSNAGLEPRSPRGEEPNFDLAWTDPDGVVVVAEVKSLTTENEEKQLRAAVGQVVRYRHQLAEHHDIVRALIAVERAPTDLSWLELCESQSILLLWPDLFASALEPSNG